MMLLGEISTVFWALISGVLIWESINAVSGKIRNHLLDPTHKFKEQEDPFFNREYARPEGAISRKKRRKRASNLAA